jgi:hypothetical protein
MFFVGFLSLVLVHLPNLGNSLLCKTGRILLVDYRLAIDTPNTNATPKVPETVFHASTNCTRRMQIHLQDRTDPLSTFCLSLALA